MAKPNAIDTIDIKIINEPELQKLFLELQTSVQNKIVMAGIKDAAQIIKKEIKPAFLVVKKNKSKTNYSALTKALKIEALKKEFGVKVGFTVEGYKYRWLQWGTQPRSYKKGTKRSIWRSKSDKSGGHDTGFIEKTDFFYKAVERTQPQAKNKISDSILKSLENTVKKYNATSK